MFANRCEPDRRRRGLATEQPLLEQPMGGEVHRRAAEPGRELGVLLDQGERPVVHDDRHRGGELATILER